MKRKMSLFVTASMVIASIGSTVPAFASEATLQASDYLTAYEMYSIMAIVKMNFMGSVPLV